MQPQKYLIFYRKCNNQTRDVYANSYFHEDKIRIFKQRFVSSIKILHWWKENFKLIVRIQVLVIFVLVFCCYVDNNLEYIPEYTRCFSN